MQQEVPLLTDWELARLIESVKRGVHAEEMVERKSDSLSEETMQEIIVTGEQAVHKIAQANLRLVGAELRKHMRRPHVNMDYEVMQHEGYLAVRHSARKFLPYMKIRFATYATNWIRQRLRREYDVQNRDDRKTLEQSPIKLDDAIGNDPGDGSTYHDVIKAQLHPQDMQEHVLTQLDLDQMMNYLNPIQRQVLLLYMATPTGNRSKKSLQEVGDELGISHEAVRKVFIELKEFLNADFVWDGDEVRHRDESMESLNIG